MRLMLVEDDPVFIRTLSDRLQLNQLVEMLKRLTSRSPKDRKEELVRLMKTTLECWKQEGMDTGSLVRHSGIWEMKTKSAKRGYYNPELFCGADTLPRHLRWEKVVAHPFPGGMTLTEQPWK